MTARFKITVRAAAAPPRVFTGRVAWALKKLIEAGEAGCAPITNPAPRWSDYVHKLRRLGVDVETIDEAHGGDFAGRHGRYVLRTPLRIIDGRGRVAA